MERGEPRGRECSSTTPSRTARASWSATSSRDALADCYSTTPSPSRSWALARWLVRRGRHQPQPTVPVPQARVGSHRGRLCRRGWTLRFKRPSAPRVVTHGPRDHRRRATDGAGSHAAHVGHPSATQPFAFVGRYAGDFTREGIADVAQGCSRRASSAGTVTDARTVDALEGTGGRRGFRVERLRRPGGRPIHRRRRYHVELVLRLAGPRRRRHGRDLGLTVEGTDAVGTYAETWRDRRVRVTGRKTALIERASRTPRRSWWRRASRSRRSPRRTPA